MNIRQEIALSLKCQIPVPDFRVQGTIEEAAELDLLSSPEWELREDVIFWSPDNTVTQLYYFNGQYLQHPLIVIDDPYLLSGRQGARLDSNLITMFPGELKLQKYLPGISEYLNIITYKGYITLTFSISKDGLMYNRIQLDLPEEYLPNLLNLYNLSEEWFIADLSNDTLSTPAGISVSLKLYAYPYYPDNNKAVLDNIPVPGAYPLSESYAISHWQERFHIKDTWAELYKLISDRSYSHNGICYNLDGGYKARKVYDMLKKQKLFM